MIKPENNFFLFGMGDREKYIYKNRSLIRYKDNEILYAWNNCTEEFIYDQYTVILTKNDGGRVVLEENEEGFFVDGKCLSASKINLPDFEEYKYPKQLRILHHEILINIIDGKPVPNYFVYQKPWYRDSAMMGMVLKATNNLHLIKDWVLSITDLYDKNNAGHCEPDNLGQLLYLISLVDDKNNPMVKKIINEAKRICENGILTGLTDFGNHQIYSTLWLKFALKELKMDDSFLNIPEEFDNYARMFWMDRDGIERATEYKNEYNWLYPYLWWAVKHFENEPIAEEFLEITYPMSWEKEASQAKYEQIRQLSNAYADNKYSAPHTWHASEMFLYLIEMEK
ncbi:MAG: hypothetical protein E7596_03325 [Ruminococcaceae bacterium]|nr:hypothetical protein [Oscillospiraceae bacterium]